MINIEKAAILVFSVYKWSFLDLGLLLIDTQAFPSHWHHVAHLNPTPVEFSKQKGHEANHFYQRRKVTCWWSEGLCPSLSFETDSLLSNWKHVIPSYALTPTSEKLIPSAHWRTTSENHPLVPVWTSGKWTESCVLGCSSVFFDYIRYWP